MKNGFSVIELLIMISVTSLTANTILDIYDDLEKKAIQIHEHEVKKTELICNFKKFKGCPNDTNNAY